MTVAGRGYFAVDRHRFRQLVDRLGGDDARLLLHLALEADPDTGAVRGNLRELAELCGASPKRLRVVLPRLEVAGLIAYRRGVNGEERGAGEVTLSANVQLDARPRRTAPDSAGVKASTAPVSAGVRPTTAPTPRPHRAHTRAETGAAPRDNAHKTEDSRQQTDNPLASSVPHDCDVDDVDTPEESTMHDPNQLTIGTLDTPPPPAPTPRKRQSRAKPTPAWSERTRDLAGRYLEWHLRHHGHESPATFAGLCNVITRFENVDEHELIAALKNARAMTRDAVEYALKAARGVGAKPARESSVERIRRAETTGQTRDALAALTRQELTA